MKGSPQLLLSLAFIVMMATYPAIGLAQEKQESSVINIGEVEWGTPGYRPCFPQGVQNHTARDSGRPHASAAEFQQH